MRQITIKFPEDIQDQDALQKAISLWQRIPGLKGCARFRDGVIAEFSEYTTYPVVTMRKNKETTKTY